MFHTLQAGARAEQRAIAAKGLTGPGYDGHSFWDSEHFVLPVLTYTADVAGTVAASPALLSAFEGLRRAVGSGDLDPTVRETAGRRCT